MDEVSNAIRILLNVELGYLQRIPSIMARWAGHENRLGQIPERVQNFGVEIV
jgi:hypothetical protein